MKNVFCIGPNKTGTTSLKKACGILGIPNSHSSEPFSFTKKVVQNMNYGDKVLDGFRTPGFFADVWCPRPSTGVPTYLMSIEWKLKLINMISIQYPDTVFINNRRFLNEWLKSRERHVKAPKPDWYWKQKVRWEKVDKKEWTKEWWEMEHEFFPFFINHEITYHEINVCGGDGWEELCAILNEPIPDTPFPRENEGGK